eukprot:9339542-Alexandrium_andersonii.AAC.1
MGAIFCWALSRLAGSPPAAARGAVPCWRPKRRALLLRPHQGPRLHQGRDMMGEGSAGSCSPCLLRSRMHDPAPVVR